MPIHYGKPHQSQAEREQAEKLVAEAPKKKERKPIIKRRGKVSKPA